MTALLLPSLALSIGFFILSFSADRLISASATYAKHCNISLIFIGMTVVAFGTSAPELLVSAVAALNNAGELAVGNGIGSNIINIGLVLSTAVLIAPIQANKGFIKKEFPILAGSMLICIALMSTGKLSMVDGLLLVFLLAIYCIYLAKSIRQGEVSQDELEFLPLTKKRAGWESLAMLLLLLISSRLMVWGAVNLAQFAGLSELTIGLTIIAFGTSLPELAAAIAGVRRGMYDIVFATVIGSNIFNLLGVIAIPSILGKELIIPDQVFSRDVPYMILLTVVLGGMLTVPLLKSQSSSTERAAYSIHRLGGGLLLMIFIFYLATVAHSII
ncbi:calcium/sodium antiporter [Vibrio sp. F13]|jgi:cation:H+ antiporter|uniref:calcium/sodium antiporter n=1 Tax=Vibrio sp. F13 TaxID=2070777 RepID=UPI0010BDE415|nr:calcium/sodium antiporter [Vibrio sp. F13]TKG01413.1 calcium/sodium antiporter [Vibrio sp. F13]